MTSRGVDHPVARGVVALGGLVLGVVAGSRLPLSFAPEVTSPKIFVSLSLPSPTDPEDVTRRYVVELESLVRGLGGVKGLRCQVSSGGVELEARFPPRSNPERLASRLLSDLIPLRGKLPSGSSLFVTPASAGTRNAMALALTGSWSGDDLAAVEEEIRRLPGVATVETFGEGEEEIHVRLRPEALSKTARIAGAVRDAVAGGASFLGLRPGGAARVPVLSAAQLPADFAVASLRALPVRLAGNTLPLGSLAEVEAGRRLRAGAHVDGRSAVLLLISRDPAVSLLTLDRGVRGVVADHASSSIRLAVLGSQADPLRSLLRGLALGAALSMGAMALLGFLRGRAWGALHAILHLPLALAAALNGCLALGLGLDQGALGALCVAMAALLPMGLLARTGVLGERMPRPALVASIVASGLLLPVGVVLGSGGLAPYLAAPAWAAAIAAFGVAAALTVLGPAPVARRRCRATGRGLRRVLSDPASVMLFSAAGIYVSLTAFGKALDPRAGARSAHTLVADVWLSEGTTLEETARRVTLAEASIAGVPGIERTFATFVPGRANLTIVPRAEERAPDRFRALKYLLAHRLHTRDAAVRLVEDRSQGPSMLGDDDGRERPEADRFGFLYRVILAGPDARSLEMVTAAIESRLRGQFIEIEPEWGPTQVRLDLDPRDLASAPDDEALARALQAASNLPLPIDVPGERGRSIAIDVPGRSVNDVPAEATLLQTPLRMDDGAAVVPASFLVGSERSLPSELTRVWGRFVLPVTIHTYHSSVYYRMDVRTRIEQVLGSLHLPAGCDLERPASSKVWLTPEKVRVLGLLSMLPLLLFATSAFFLGSIWRALLSLLPLLVGIAAVAPLFALLSATPADPQALLLLAIALCCTLPSALHVAWGERTTLYRRVRESFAALSAGAVGAVLLLGAAAIAATDADGSVYLGTAGVSAAASVLGSAIALPAALSLARILRQRGRAGVIARNSPPRFEQGPVSLAARSLTKTYGSGFRALTTVSFDLSPGIVGLLGPNGAGKTTLLRLLTGLYQPTRGQVLYRDAVVDAASLAAYRRHVGFLPQECNAYPGFTATQFLEHWAREKGIGDPRRRRDEVSRLLSLVGLQGDASRRVRDFSGGMRQRIGIAQALLGSPPVLIVDEPTTGLDVASRNRFREVLLAIGRDRIVILSTHLASDVEALATRLLVLARGRLCYDGPPAGLLSHARGRVFDVVLSDAEVPAFARAHRVTTRVRVLEGIRMRAIAAAGEVLPGVPCEPTLEEAYLCAVEPAPGTARSPAGRFAFLRDLRDRRGTIRGAPA